MSTSARPEPHPGESEPSGSADELRRTFGYGISPHAAGVLLDARQAGLAWPEAARAVADGLAAHYCWPTEPPPAPRAAPSHPWLSLAAGLGLYVALRPVLGFGHELAVALLGQLQHALVASGWWQPLLARLPLDPVYAGAAIRFLGAVQVRGVAVSGALGDWAHALAPGFFLAPDLAMPGAGSSMVAAPGATVLARGLAAFGAEVVLLGIAVWVFLVGRRTGRGWLAMLGLLLQAQIALNHLLDTPLSLGDLEASGLPFAISLLLPGGRESAWFTGSLARWAPAWQQLAIGSCLVVLAYASALAWLGLATGGWRLLGAGARRALRRQARRRRPSARPRAAAAPLWSTAAVAVAVAISPVGALALGESNWRPVEVPVVERGARVRALRASPALRALRLSGPTPVRIEQAPDGAWRYVVDDRPTVIRGMGYNPQYAALRRGERADRYERDFGTMRQLGVNTVEGWFEEQFDELTLDYAARNGLGVIMPFELNQDWDYASPDEQARILERVSACVRRYRDHPAVRIWAPGNENLHRVLYPKWVSQERVPAALARAEAFAAFMPRLVDAIRQLDPNHPVLYRDAEDVYLPRLKAAFERTGVARPWLIYGANVYAAPRLAEIIARWPSQWLGGPLLISEFAPGGTGPADRPAGFERDWARIRARPDVVIGGLAYTWASNGPEELDRVFGLVDEHGAPRDGALAALGAAYLADSDPEP